VQKLQQLQEREDIVLAIPNEAREAFASIVASFPIAWYDGQLSVTELLKLLRSRYDDFAERLAAIDVAAVHKRVESEGLLPERACYELLHCYRRSELALAAKRVIGQEVAFVEGIGLYRVDWMEQLRTSFVEWIDNAGVLSLADVLRESRARWPTLANCEDATLEALLGLWPEVHVRRSSIFDATVEVVNQAAIVEVDVGAQLIAPSTVALNNQRDKTKRPTREKRSVQKKRIIKEAAQGDLWK